MDATSRPTTEQERELNNLMENKPTEVFIKDTKTSYKIYTPHKATMRKISDIANEDGNDDKLSCKVVAAIVLRGFFRTKLFYWFLWRWFYYVKEYDDYQLQDIIAENKKKVPLMNFLVNTMLVTGTRDTMMTMTKKEAERIRQEQAGAQPTR